MRSIGEVRLKPGAAAAAQLRVLSRESGKLDTLFQHRARFIFIS